MIFFPRLVLFVYRTSLYKLKSIFIAAVDARWAVFFDEHWKNLMTLF
jgi:hypothetical protein